MRQVRLRQQEIANERAKEAEKRRKQKEIEEKERRKNVAKQSAADSFRKETTSTSGSGNSGGFNPMQPWTASSSGYR